MRFRVIDSNAARAAWNACTFPVVRVHKAEELEMVWKRSSMINMSTAIETSISIRVKARGGGNFTWKVPDEPTRAIFLKMTGRRNVPNMRNSMNPGGKIEDIGQGGGRRSLGPVGAGEKSDDGSLQVGIRIAVCTRQHGSV